MAIPLLSVDTHVSHQFRHHYTREEARRLLPQVTQWLASVLKARQELAKAGVPMDGFLNVGCDVGGSLSQRYLGAFIELRALLREFSRRDIFIKDLDRGLIDFPSFVGGREVFLCWEMGEADIEHWHELDAGFSGREPIES